MKETKSELKIVAACIGIIALPLLGIDAQSLAALFSSPEVTGATKAFGDGVMELKEFSQASENKTLSGYIAALGASYGAYRTIVKAVGKWAAKGGNSDGANKVAETLGSS